jgi:nicotinate phosphoribosyltransferase
MIIKSILDTDLYKLTMQQAVWKLYSKEIVRYEFINRGNTIFPDQFSEKLKQEIEQMQNIRLTQSEKNYLNKLDYFEPAYLEFLSEYKFNTREIDIEQINGKLFITIQGYWLKTILWEVPVMAIISELYFKETNQEPNERSLRKTKNIKKALIFCLSDTKYADFGTRRRYSFNIQNEVIKDFVNHNPTEFIGTSNIYFAKKYKINPIGTYAHEWVSYHGANYGYKLANHLAMKYWKKVYKNKLNIALSDTFGSNNFFKAFDSEFSGLFDGIRQDSGNPYSFINKTIAHYKKLKIDPLVKTIVFSDSLNPKKAIQIRDYCFGKINCFFGIGTNFTNDVGVKPLNMVIKMTSLLIDYNWCPVIKLSDETGKYTGNKNEIEKCKSILKL